MSFKESKPQEPLLEALTEQTHVGVGGNYFLDVLATGESGHVDHIFH
jgi:hypothetical protein